MTQNEKEINIRDFLNSEDDFGCDCVLFFWFREQSGWNIEPDHGGDAVLWSYGEEFGKWRSRLRITRRFKKNKLFFFSWTTQASSLMSEKVRETNASVCRFPLLVFGLQWNKSLAFKTLLKSNPVDINNTFFFFKTHTFPIHISLLLASKRPRKFWGHYITF